MSADSRQVVIMIIDDEPENLNVLGEMLQQEGWEVRAFTCGELALVAAREEPPELVLLDICMPGMDGYEVCRRFKLDESLGSLPIIFLSAFSEPADKVRAFEAGGVDYVIKPFAEIEVLSRVRTHLRLRQHQLHLEELVRQRVTELTEAHRRLRIWDDAKTLWLNMLSHEMRTPLTGVFGIAELLFMNLPTNADYQDLRKEYDLSCHRINKLMDDALTLAQIDVAAERFVMCSTQLTPILSRALDTIAKQVTDIEVHAFIDAVTGITVLGEAELLNRAFTDLLLTATHCVCTGENIKVEAHVSDKQVKVIVSTSGKSLPIESLETFFDVGGQRTLLKGGGDFGLSSALASRVMRLFNGRIIVHNGFKSGIVIEVSLPIDNHFPRTERHDI